MVTEAELEHVKDTDGLFVLADADKDFEFVSES